MNTNVFIVHSNKFMKLTRWFGDFLRVRGLNPIIQELIPNAGRLWGVPEKSDYLLSICKTALVIATPDEIQDGSPVPRLDVSFEIGRLKESKKTIILKEETVKLPTSLGAIYIGFVLDNPEMCLEKLDKELKSIFGENINLTAVFDKKAPTYRKPFILEFEGMRLSPDNPIQVRKAAQSILMTNPNKQKEIISSMIALLDDDDDDKRWICGMMIEEVLEFDSGLIPLDVIIRMSMDKSFSVRSSAAVCLYTLANLSPGRVPLDIVIPLADSLREDWYVFTPALATLQTLAHKMPRALQALIEMAAGRDGAYISNLLLQVVRNDPHIIDVDSLERLRTHSDRIVREYFEEMKMIIESRPKHSNVIRYGPF